MNKKRKLKLKHIFIIILVILFVLLFFCLKDIYSSLKQDSSVKTLSTIDEYGYVLNENDSPYFKELFEKLKNNLESDEIDEEEYAKSISKLFVVDFYSLKYSMSKSDVGGIQFVYTDYQSSFTTKAKDTVYAYVDSNIYGKRKQKLPNISKVSIKDIKQDKYQGKKEQDDDAYFVDLEVEYDEDLEYPSEVSLVLIHKDNKLQIVEMK